ncbi:MAG: recombinase family protein [Oscillospiraceae bacterium]|nr:recombinase family protein [Oscillospiraceae bacterium]
MITAMYLRKSRAEENEPVSDTLSRHREILTSFAAKQNMIVADVYEEVVSGDSLYARPQMLCLMENLSKYESVLCMDIDRLGRGAMHEQGLIFDAFRKSGTLIVTPAKTYDMADDMDDSLISFKALFAREEYKMIRNRLRRGTVKAVEEGCYLSNAPFGYKQTRVNKKPTLEIEPKEAEGVRLIFNMYLEGKGCQSVADTVHALGYRPRRGAKFSRSTIAKIIRNPVYTGKVVWNQYRFERPKNPGEKHIKRIKPADEWMVVEGLHEPIITQELFDEANKRLAGRYNTPYNKGQIMNPLAGVLFCKNCGRAMIRQPLKNKKYNQPMIICQTAGCMMGSSLEVTEELFVEGIKLLQINLVKNDPHCQTGQSAPNTTAIAENELLRLEQQMKKQHELLEQGVYDIDTFITRREEINKSIAATQETLKNSKEKTDDAVLVKKINTLLSEYRTRNADEKNQLIKGIVKRATYHKPKGSKWGTLPEIEITELR